MACLAELSENELRTLATLEGFAGQATVAEGVCTWQRMINLQRPKAGRDIGRLERASGGLYEHGVDADLVELWLDQKTDVHVAEGRVLISEAVTQGLTGGDRDLLADLFQAEQSLGRIDGEAFRRDWTAAEADV